jgi:hypothetical protein
MSAVGSRYQKTGEDTAGWEDFSVCSSAVVLNFCIVNLSRDNMVMGPDTKNDYAGEGQQQIIALLSDGGVLISRARIVTMCLWRQGQQSRTI